MLGTHLIWLLLFNEGNFTLKYINIAYRSANENNKLDVDIICMNKIKYWKRINFRLLELMTVDIMHGYVRYSSTFSDLLWSSCWIFYLFILICYNMKVYLYFQKWTVIYCMSSTIFRIMKNFILFVSSCSLTNIWTYMHLEL